MIASQETPHIVTQEGYNTRHHKHGKFHNIWGRQHRTDLLRAIPWLVRKAAFEREGTPAQSQPLSKADFKVAEKSGLWWLGHATCLVKLGEHHVITDPVFSDRVSPVNFVGPRRYAPAPCTIEQLPKIHFVVISHNHYDHLDKESVFSLVKYHNPAFICPLGVAAQLREMGVHRIFETDWRQTVVAESLRFHCLPAKHFSGRWLNDRDQTLWASYLIESSDKKIYFAGDTAYSPHFAEIGSQFPAIDMALMPIGAYAPRWFMREVHVDPQEAVRAFVDLKAREMLGIHWGTFDLADEPLDEPPMLTRRYAHALGIKPECIHLPDAGGYIPLP